MATSSGRAHLEKLRKTKAGQEFFKKMTETISDNGVVSPEVGAWLELIRPLLALPAPRSRPPLRTAWVVD